MRLTLLGLVATIVAACASMGRPEGGPRDEDPPVFVKSNPGPGALNVSRDRVEIEFDENVQVKDVMDRVVVSPPQKSMPKVMAIGRRVRIDFADSLLPNTTYTIDFTDAISDLNENNELDGFAFEFSTGPTIDTLCISGMVFQAENLEPAQGITVGVHSNLADTAIRTISFDRITKTNKLGQFTLRNLKPGTYRIYALNDANRDGHWDRTEDVAFYDVTITPSASSGLKADTIKTTAGTDSIVMRQVTYYTPNDVLLTWFNENYKSQYLQKYERQRRNIVSLTMGAPLDTLPELTIVGGDFDGQSLMRHAVLEASATKDTLQYWLTTPEVMATDSLFVAARYLRTDTLDRLSWTTDTINLVYREPKRKGSEKDRNRDKMQVDTTQGPPPVTLLGVTPSINSSLDVYSPMVLKLDQPLKSLTDSMVHLEVLVDTLWTPVEPPRFALTDSLKPLLLQASYDWDPGQKYRLTIDSLAITGVYDRWNGPIMSEFTVKKLEDYANLTFNITGLDTMPAMAVLLNGQDKQVMTVPIEHGQAIFRHINPGVYYARLFIDGNRNGKWDTGLLDSIQPEEVYYFPKKLNLKKNWDVEQTWDIFETPVDLQKPDDIKKNKPKDKKGMTNADSDEEDEYGQYYDEFGNPSVDPNDPFGKNKNKRYNNRNANAGSGSGYRDAPGSLRR